MNLRGHFVGGWSDERVLAKVREMVLPEIERHGSIEAWIIDDTSFPKQGAALGGGGEAILRAARQTGELSSRGITVAGQRSC
jgi:DDE superfamily endonuclease